MSRTAKAVHARYEHGRWIADCPICRGAEMVAPGRRFLCLSEHGFELWGELDANTRLGAYNLIMGLLEGKPGLADFGVGQTMQLRINALAARGEVYDVVFPNEREQIEQVMMLRPSQHCNWFPKDHFLAIERGIPHGQSIKDLVAENKAHGIETPKHLIGAA